MKLASSQWAKLYRSQPSTWTAELLALCSLDELEALAKLLGVPFGGTKAQRIARLLDMVSLRTELASWGEYDGGHVQAHALATEVMARYRRPALLALARRAGCFTSTTKRGLVLGLLSWRSRCRADGQAFNAHIVAARRAAPIQHQLNLG